MASDPTFRNYTTAQAASYAAGRSAYSERLHAEILSYRNGPQGSLLDIGCGPGTSTLPLAKHFTRTTGVDAGPAMISAARQLTTDESIAFVNAPAEALPSTYGVPPGSVDVVASGMAAHWFEMPAFWAAAREALKPGGVVALWCAASLYPHPTRTPHAERVREVLRRFELETLHEYTLPGNRLAMGLYKDLGLPWECGVGGFARESLERRVWNGDGSLEPGEQEFFNGSRWETWEDFSAAMGTASMVTRWREANPGKEDCVEGLVRELRGVLGEDCEGLETGSAMVLLLLRKDEETRK